MMVLFFLSLLVANVCAPLLAWTSGQISARSLVCGNLDWVVCCKLLKSTTAEGLPNCSLVQVGSISAVVCESRGCMAGGS
jgi:hypothetical protein